MGYLWKSQHRLAGSLKMRICIRKAHSVSGAEVRRKPKEEKAGSLGKPGPRPSTADVPQAAARWPPHLPRRKWGLNTLAATEVEFVLI